MLYLINRSFKLIFKFIIFILIASIIVGLAISIIFPIAYKNEIYKYSMENELDPFLVAAIINVESKYDKDAISNKDARGLMQIGLQTGNWGADVLAIEGFDSNKLYDPEINIRIGTWYLKQLKSEFNNDMNLVLAAYNAGSGNVSKWLKDESYSKDGNTLSKIPFKETDEYLDKVKFNQKVYSTIYKHYMEKPDTSNGFYTDVIILLRTYLSNLIKSLRKGGYLEI
ncbi:lytic transglycosylase domain-containing protein [Tissierella sp. Yu-01]|uniref:lytic transglycosylase domain-containing protein n=1 Tax=Tissierella sp. Yu-01 TaxID=3035694 RepID=UPI00240D6F05|nr:lytic transglycosylase domain-containing protein [Tissierella sp. Yu-01]WFA09476.1 lytic transglycosylase domain-containing protein [Tissierella sp. Yu-01]